MWMSHRKEIPINDQQPGNEVEWSTERFEVKTKERLVNDQGLVLFAQLGRDKRCANADWACC